METPAAVAVVGDDPSAPATLATPFTVPLLVRVGNAAPSEGEAHRFARAIASVLVAELPTDGHVAFCAWPALVASAARAICLAFAFVPLPT